MTYLLQVTPSEDAREGEVAFMVSIVDTDSGRTLTTMRRGYAEAADDASIMDDIRARARRHIEAVEGVRRGKRAQAVADALTDEVVRVGGSARA